MYNKYTEIIFIQGSNSIYRGRHTDNILPIEKIFFARLLQNKLADFHHIDLPTFLLKPLSNVALLNSLLF